MVKRIISCLMVCLIGITSVPVSVYAQQPPASVVFSQEELDQLLAPIALYPDPVLSQILMAATYPLETVEAARFVQANPNLTGDALAQAVAAQPWDASVKALVQFPSVLTMMDQQLAWTQKLGDAFLAQQANVMDTVQSLRARAQSAGTLVSTPQEQVVTQDNSILIQPYSPETIYVPFYDPVVVYGPWWWPNRPPMFWSPPLMYRPAAFGNLVAGGIVFGVGVAIVDSLFLFSRPDWHAHQFVVYGPGRYSPNRPGTVWAHDPAHRLGVAYRDTATRNRFVPNGNNIQNRDAFRGHVNDVAPSARNMPSAPARQNEPNRQFDARMPTPNVQARPTQTEQPRQMEQPRQTEQPRQMERAPAQQAAQSEHPFMPSGPARAVESNAERGRASREQSAPAGRGQERHEQR